MEPVRGQVKFLTSFRSIIAGYSRVRFQTDEFGQVRSEKDRSLKQFLANKNS